jgi:hypothetical protein
MKKKGWGCSWSQAVVRFPPYVASSVREKKNLLHRPIRRFGTLKVLAD